MATIIRSKVAAATKATTTTAPTNLIHNINKLTRVVVDEVGEVKLYDGEKVVKSIDLGVAHSNLVHTLQIEIPCAAFRHKTPEDYNIFLNYKKEPNGTAGQMELVNTNWGSFAGKYIYYYKVPRTPFTETPGANFIFDIKLEAITAGNNAADEKEVWYSRTFGGATSSVSTIIPTIADLTLPENGVVDSGSGLIKKDIDVVLTDTGFEVGRKDLEYIAVADDKYARRFKFTNCDISRDYYVICTNNTESLTALKVIHDNVSGSYCWIPSNITSVSGSYWFMVAAGGGVGESDELWTSEPVLLKVVSRVGEDNNVVLTSNTEEIKTASDNSVIVQNPNGVYDLEMTGAELKSKLTAIDSAATMEYVSNALSNAGGVVSVDVLPPIEAAQENVIYGVQENDLDALFTVQEGYVKTADGAITFTQYVNNFFGDQGIEIQKTNWIVVANHDEIVKDILEPVGDSTSLMN